MEFLYEVPAFGYAKVYELAKVDRHDGMGGGYPGCSALKFISCRGGGETAFFADLLKAQEDNPWVLYAIENGAVVLLEFADPQVKRQLYLEEPFLDRGVRKLVPLGSKVVVASAETADAWSDDASRLTGEKLSHIGNTGRCGSTLMHKLLLATDVCSLSEPHWLDQLLRRPMHDDARVAAFKTCVRLDTELAARSTFPKATYFSLNPKGGGPSLQAAIARAYPSARHVFMYRACHKVVESFGSIFEAQSGGPSILTRLSWAAYPRITLPPPLKNRVAALDGVELAMLRFSKPGVVMHVAKWLDAVLGWIEIKPSIQPPPLVIRMDEFVASSTKADAIAHVMAHLRISQYDQEKALATFDQNSQKGSNMTKSSSQSRVVRKFLTPYDAKTIRDAVLPAAFKDLPAEAATLRGDNILLADTLLA